MADEFKSFSQIPAVAPEPTAQELDRRTRAHPYHERNEKVVNGTIKWKPIDQVAARVVAPASWYCQSPPPPPSFMKKPEDFGKETGSIRTTRKQVEEGHVEEVLNRDDVERVAVDYHQGQTEKALANLGNLEARARDIHDSLDYLLGHIREPFESANELITRELALLREKRFAIDTETRLIMNQLKEVRQFFLDPSHDSQVDRLRDFVDLCERLKALKESGFLDTIADTILRL